jgi:phosphoribosylanthranilate isomerase
MGDYYYNGYSDEGYNIEGVFKEYKRSGKLILIPKRNIITNSSNIISTTSSCSPSRANSTNTKENNNSGLKNKNKSRLSRESKIKKELADSPVNNKNISPQTISLKESPESKKNNSESKIYKDKYYKARFSGEKVALEVKFWKKLHKNKRKKRYCIIHNENIEVNRSPKEYNKNKNIVNDSEEDTQINSRKDSPIKFVPSAQKELKFLNGKLKKDNNPELLELENNYLNSTKKRKQEDKNDNSNGKENDKLNSSKFIEISSQYGDSSEKKNNNMAIITLSDSDKDEEPGNQNNPKDVDGDDNNNLGKKLNAKDGAANNRGDTCNKL